MPDYMTRKGEDNWFFRKKKPSKKEIITIGFLERRSQVKNKLL